MKHRFLYIVVIFILAAKSSVYASTNFISRPVGVTTINIPANSQAPVSLPYVPFVPTMDSLVGGQLTNDVGVLLWNNIAQRYEHVDRVNGKWRQVSTTGEVSVVAGDAFWIVNRQYTNQTLLLGGEVNLAGSNTTMLAPGMNLIGLPKSAAVSVTNSGLAGLGKDRLLDAQGEAVSIMAPGEGYWYLRNETGWRAWVEVIPSFTDMFPEEGSLPAITDIKVAPTSGSHVVILTIALDDDCRKIDIYYKDQLSADTLALDKDWQIAEEDMPVSGKTVLEWADTDNSQRKAVSEVFARYYLVGRSDLLGADNIPLSRSKFVFGRGAQGAGGQVFGNTASDLGSDSTASNVLSSVSSNLVPVSSFHLSRIIYVDRHLGRDSLSGKSPVVVVPDGPKKTIRSGLDEAGNNGATMVVTTGHYGEDLNISGRNISVRIEGDVNLSGTMSPEAPVAPQDTQVTNMISTNLTGNIN